MGDIILAIIIAPAAVWALLSIFGKGGELSGRFETLPAFVAFPIVLILTPGCILIFLTPWLLITGNFPEAISDFLDF